MRFIFDGSKLRPRTLFLVSLALSFTESVIGSEIRERAVLVVANGADRDSVRLARHYVRLRSLPEEHIIHLNTSNKEQISWPEFITEVFNPLRAKLVEGKWIDAIASSLLDEHGRRRYAISGHSLRYLVVCRGIPLRSPMTGIVRLTGTLLRMRIPLAPMQLRSIPSCHCWPWITILFEVGWRILFSAKRFPIGSLKIS